MKSYLPPRFVIDRDAERCIACQVCVRQCSFDAHAYDGEEDDVRSYEENCVGCHRCAVFCPTQALNIRLNPLSYRTNENWRPEVIEDILRQSENGGVLLTGMGNDKPYRVYWDHLLLNASQVTNPSIDPLREPMELRTFLGRKPDRVEVDPATLNLKTQLAPQVAVELPVLFSAISYGAVNLNVQESLARAATEVGTLFNVGEGGLHRKLYRYSDNVIVQVASGRFGVHPAYLDAARVIEIKIGQGAKPGIGGHLPGGKVTEDVAETRMIPTGTDALSPAPQHDIYSIEDLAQLIYALKEATNYSKPVCVKIAAVHNSAAIASGMVRAGADIIALDGLRGATGAAPKVIRDNVGIPIEVHHHEVATAGQGGIDMKFDSLTNMADKVMWYKYIVKNIARKHGKVATFMPKPLFNDNGSGMHTHMSLWKNSTNVFYDPEGYALISETARYYIGGLLKHSPALMALCAPTTNSYKRLVPGYEAPVNLVYSARNRSAAVRIPVYTSNPQTKRLEYRPPDGSCNPYLAFSALLMAGLDGVENEIDPGPPLDKNTYELTPAQVKAIPTVPGSLDEALRALEEDYEFLLKGGVFTSDVLEVWLEYKREHELDPVRLRPHPWEFYLYFDI